ncbi:hypothetical protein [Agrobacterium sp. SORGH_AS 787]|uniref:hypothetical protein n=1 Tax=Agrobacterium sp. SORGH_AS 787 TaxID=3041775 RepID=UPI002782787F|nr:putative membrane protein YfcA [Rhizobium sp. SORGH_AS_0787]
MPSILSTGLSSSALAFLVLVALSAGLARGFSGFGAALIFVPLASSVMGPQIAVPLLLVVDGVMTLGLYRGQSVGRIDATCSPWRSARSSACPLASTS